MRTLLTAIIFFSLSVANGQTIEKAIDDALLQASTKELELAGGIYQFNNSIPISLSPQLMENLKQKKITEGYKIKVLYELDNIVYFQYLNFINSEKKVEYNNDQVFFMPKKQFLQLVSPLYNRFKGATIGAYSVPFRLRDLGGDNFDFESSLSLQANMVFGFGRQIKDHSWFDLSLGIGVTGVNISKSNTNATPSFDEERTASALTISFGGVIKPIKGVNIGAFLGWDFLNDKDRETKWVFDRKGWLGLGINVSFSEIKTEKPPSKGGDN